MSFSTQKGITLIELIVAVSVLSFALAGPMTLAASSLRATQDARNELIRDRLRLLLGPSLASPPARGLAE